MQPVCWSALHILRLLELLPCSQDTSGDYIVTYTSSYIMTKVPIRSMKAIHLKGLPFWGCSSDYSICLDRLKLSLSRKVEKSTLNFCEFYLLRFIFIRRLVDGGLKTSILASVTCDLVPFIEGTLWWYTLVCTMIGFAWHPVLSCLVSFEISGGCTLLILCGLMPSYLIVRRQGLL